MTSADALLVRPLKASDRAAWDVLWHDYLAFYKTTLPPHIFDTYFGRLIGDDPQDFNALIAEHEGEVVGLAHFLFHRHGWRVENVCYLQDLFALPKTRGKGVGRALIEGVYAAADAAGAPAVYWLTQDHNHEARKLYDRIGNVSNFIRYDRA